MTHTLSGDAETREVYLDGKFLDPRPSQKLYNHSPDGFNWGYGGSGPAQLALAIVLKLTGKSDGYQKFKFGFIGSIPQGRDFDVTFEWPFTPTSFKQKIIDQTERAGGYENQ